MTRITVVCISFIIISLMFVGISYAKINTDDIAGVWLFDEGSGDVAKDSSGNGNDGAIKGAKWAAGKFGKALEFNGKDNCVSTGKKLLDSLPEFSIVVWAKPGDITANRVGLVGQNDSPEFGFINPINTYMVCGGN